MHSTLRLTSLLPNKPDTGVYPSGMCNYCNLLALLKLNRYCYYLLKRIPESDPYWSAKPPATRKECLHQQVTRAVPDFECHLGPRQIVCIKHNLLMQIKFTPNAFMTDESSFQLAGPFSNLQFQTFLL